MPYVVARHQSFLVPSGSARDEDAKHLHIISTSPCKNGLCLLLTTSTIREGVWHDPTRVLEAGCHPFINQKSFVNYARSIVKRCDGIVKCVEGWTYHPKENFDADLTELILTGVWESEMTPNYVFDYLNSLKN